MIRIPPENWLKTLNRLDLPWEKGKVPSIPQSIALKNISVVGSVEFSGLKA